MADNEAPALVLFWRRRVAAMRLFHLCALASALMGGLVGLGSPLRNALQGTSLSARSIGDLVVCACLLLTLGWMWYRLRKFARACDAGLLGVPIALPEFPQLQQLLGDAERLLGVPERSFRFHCVNQTSPAQIVRSRGTVHVLLAFGALVSLERQPRITLGIVWHEIGHYVQWDTTLGNWTYRANRVLGIIVMVTTILVSTFVLLFVVGEVALKGSSVLTKEVWGLVGRIALGVVFLVGVFLGARFWRQFCEYNSDLTAVVAGYGPSIADQLRNDTARPNTFRRLTGFHPRSRRRAEFVDKVIARYGSEQATIGSVDMQMRIQLRDYGYAIAAYILPIVGGFLAAALLLQRFMLEPLVVQH
jgi:hypothetical protein